MDYQKPNPDEVQVLDFVNESRIKKKQLKIRAFNLFHRCQLKCVQNIKSNESQNCLKKCEIALDDFDQYKKSTGGPDFKSFFWAIPTENPELIQKYQLKDQEIMDYQKKCIDMEVKWQDRLQKLDGYLNNWEEKLKK